MLGSIIYAITDDPEDIFWFSASDLHDDVFAHYHYTRWQTRQKAPNELAEELEMVLGATAGEDEHGVYITLDQQAIDAYWKATWTKFKDALSMLNAATESDVRSYSCPGFSKLEEALDDQYGDMFYSTGDGVRWRTTQDFMLDAEPGTKYYICGAVYARIT